MNAPIVRDRKGEFRDVLEELRADGFTRVRVDGEVRLLEEEIVLDEVQARDRRGRRPARAEARPAPAPDPVGRDGRVAADGLVAVDVVDGDSMLFSGKFACLEHGVSLPELQPRIFSFNSPHGRARAAPAGARSSRSIPT